MKMTGKYPEEIQKDLETAKKVLEQMKKVQRAMQNGHLLFEHEKKLLRSHDLKAERYFNKICNSYPAYTYAKMQWICCNNLGMSKRLFAEYKRRRKEKLKDYREEPRPDPRIKGRILSYLKRCGECPALDELPRILKISPKKANTAIDNLRKSKKIQIRARRFDDGKTRPAVVLRNID